MINRLQNKESEDANRVEMERRKLIGEIENYHQRLKRLEQESEDAKVRYAI